MCLITRNTPISVTLEITRAFHFTTNSTARVSILVDIKIPTCFCSAFYNIFVNLSSSSLKHHESLVVDLANHVTSVKYKHNVGIFISLIFISYVTSPALNS